MLQRLYFRFGMRWRHRIPTFADYPQMRTIAVILMFVLMAWGWAMERYYTDQVKAEARDTYEWKEAYRKALDVCLSPAGGHIYFRDASFAFECSAKPLGKI